MGLEQLRQETIQGALKRPHDAVQQPVQAMRVELPKARQRRGIQGGHGVLA
jgi:hypothetical protein